MNAPLTLEDWEREAETRVEPSAWKYFRSGGDSEATLAANRAAYADWSIDHRVLVDVSKLDASTTMLGTRIPFPIAVAPTAYHALANPEGERASARGTHAAGTIFTLSTLATTTIEDVASASNGPLWFQLYVHRDREMTRELVSRAVAAGYGAIVLTVDAPVWGRRLVNVRDAFELPPPLAPVNLGPERGRRNIFLPDMEDSLTWKDLDWLRSLSNLPLVLKGVARGDDARLAARAGVAAVIVSNHGGRQLDGATATLRALPEIASAAGGQMEVYMDGGIRWGTDVLKAVAQGARAVFIGRPILWGLAVDGAAGVTAVLFALRDELARAMALAGAPTLADITPDLLRPQPR